MADAGDAGSCSTARRARCVIDTEVPIAARRVDAALPRGRRRPQPRLWRRRTAIFRPEAIREDMMLMCERSAGRGLQQRHMKFTLSWLKEHLDTDEPLEKLADKLTMIGLEVEHIEDKAKALAPFTIARVISAEQHPNADRLRVCMVDTGDGGSAGAGRVRRAECARGPRQRVLAARHLHSRQEHHARRRHHPRRREPRHAVLGGRIADLRRSRRHHGAAGRRADRRRLRAMGRARRSRARNQPDAEPAGLHRRARHRPRSRRRRHGQVQGSRRSSRSRANSPAR